MKRQSNAKWISMPEINVYLTCLFIFALILLIYERWLGTTAVFICLIFLIYNRINAKIRKQKWTEYLEDLTEDIDWATRYTVLNIPMALSVVEDDGKIIWYNPKFSTIFGQKLIEKNIDKCISQFNLKELIEKKEQEHEKTRLTIEDKTFEIEFKRASIRTNRREQKEIIILYFKDITNYLLLENVYDRTRLVVMYVQVDNYDEVMHQTHQENRPLLIASIDRVLRDWVSAVNGCMQKYDDDEYYIVMETQALNIIQDSKFKLLDEVREIDEGNPIPVTLSIGVGFEGETPQKTEEYARDAIDLSLGRGGDQAVVKTEERLLFYGGKTKAVEKRAKVKSRVIANALRKLVQESNDIYIMGHRNIDLDALGAALGIYRCAAHSRKPAYIVVNEYDSVIKETLHRVREDDYKEIFISREAALAHIQSESLVVIVDTHRPDFVEVPELLKQGARTVVIDHHRRGAEQIEDAVLSYLEPYASSTCELVTELVQYYDDKVLFESIEAETLLAGIIMDTKSFTFKTGVRTFEAASYLRRGGADPVKVKEFFEEDLRVYRARAETVAAAQYISDDTVISVCTANEKYASIVAAQAADELINLKDISASFVLCKIQDKVNVSARSDGNINMQVILEKIGGGGHMTMAGAQLEVGAVNEAMDIVVAAFKEYNKEKEMEV